MGSPTGNLKTPFNEGTKYCKLLVYIAAFCLTLKHPKVQKKNEFPVPIINTTSKFKACLRLLQNALKYLKPVLDLDFLGDVSSARKASSKVGLIESHPAAPHPATAPSTAFQIE